MGRAKQDVGETWRSNAVDRAGTGRSTKLLDEKHAKRLSKRSGTATAPLRANARAKAFLHHSRAHQQNQPAKPSVNLHRNTGTPGAMYVCISAIIRIPPSASPPRGLALRAQFQACRSSRTPLPLSSTPEPLLAHHTEVRVMQILRNLGALRQVQGGLHLVTTCARAPLLCPNQHQDDGLVIHIIHTAKHNQ